MFTTHIFKTHFREFVCEGDTIEATTPDGFTLTATVYRDDCSDRPDQRQDGFWPSLDPNDAGYIGPKSKAALARHKARAQAIMTAWENDEWFYCGVAVTVKKHDLELTHQFHHALWGVECNYPAAKKARRNVYLRDVANELACEALDEARAKLATIIEAEKA